MDMSPIYFQGQYLRPQEGRWLLSPLNLPSIYIVCGGTSVQGKPLVPHPIPVQVSDSLNLGR